MYLSQDKSPEEALERARQAVSVWADWMDENEVEPPEIERPDFGEQLKDAMRMVADKLPNTSISQLLPQTPDSEVQK
jgi:hypothetical protein